MIKIGFIGAGNMGTALAKAAVACDGVSVYLYDKDEEKAAAAAKAIGAEFSSNITIASECDYIFLAVKPNIIPFAAAEISTTLKSRSGYTVVSMAAGVSLDSLAAAFAGVDAPIISCRKSP